MWAARVLQTRHRARFSARYARSFIIEEFPIFSRFFLDAFAVYISFEQNREPGPITQPHEDDVRHHLDGTITRSDVLDELIARFAEDDSWKRIEWLWQSGRIGSRACLEREFALLRAEADQIEQLLKETRL